MIDEEIKIVRHTWMNVAKEDGPDIGELFYSHLFERYPNLKLIFKHSTPSYSRWFVTMMNCLVNKLNDPNVIHDARSLGKKYAENGIKDEHYEYMREAFFWALRKKLGDQWNPTVMVSWIWFYSTISFIMKGGSSEKTSHAS